MNHYWVEKDRFLAGEYPRDKDEKTSQAKIDALIQLGVSAFIDLTHEADGMEPYTPFLEAHPSRGISYQRFPIPDLSVPESDTVTKQILDAIDEHIARGRVVYVHCWGGVGRTGVIVGCWLARHGFPGKAALTRLRELWRQNPKSRIKPRSPETTAQERYITGWRDKNAEKRRDIFISNKFEENANDADFWEWLDEEDQKEYETLRKKGKLVEINEGEDGTTFKN